MINKISIPIILLTLVGCDVGNKWDKEAAKATCAQEGFDSYLNIYTLKGSFVTSAGSENIVICPDRDKYVINYNLIKRSEQ